MAEDAQIRKQKESSGGRDLRLWAALIVAVLFALPGMFWDEQAGTVILLVASLVLVALDVWDVRKKKKEDPQYIDKMTRTQWVRLVFPWCVAFGTFGMVVGWVITP